MESGFRGDDQHLGGSLDSRKYKSHIQTPKGQIILKTVNELIDPTTGKWDEWLIRDIF